MDTTQILLTYAPRDAIVMMLNIENGTNFTIDDILVGPPTTVAGSKNTEVTLSVRPPRGKNDQLPYGNMTPIQFKYNRLDVAQHFNGVLGGFDIELPTSTQILLDEITRRLGQEFVLDDIVLEDISRKNATIYKLRAKSESLRWYGEMAVVVGGVVDLNSYLSAISPPTLGTLNNRRPYVTVNAVNPGLNLTALQDEIKAIPLNTPSQDNPELRSIFAQGVPSPDNPGYRTPAFDNRYFENGGLGWYLEGSAASDAGQFELIRNDSNRARLYRNVQAKAGDLIEYTVDLAANDAVISKQVAFELVDPATDNVISSSWLCVDGAGPQSMNYTGLTHLYFRTTVDNPYVSVSLYSSGDAESRSVSIVQFSAAVFPKRFLNAGRVLENAEVIDAESSQFNGTQLQLSAGAARKVEIPKVLPEGRSALFRFKVGQAGTAPLSVYGELDGVDPQTIASSVSVGDVVELIVNKPPLVTSNNSIYLEIGVGDSWSFDEISVQVLPFAWKRSLTPSKDFANSTSLLVSNDSSDVSVSVESGYLKTTQLTPTPTVVKTSGYGLAQNEAFKLSLRTVGQPLKYLDVSLKNIGATLTYGSGAVWNTNASRRLLHPIDVRGEGVNTSNAYSSKIMATFTMRDGAFGPGVTAGTFAMFNQFGCTITESKWAMVPIPSPENLYGSVKTANHVQITNGYNGLSNKVTHAAEFNLSTFFTTTYTGSRVVLPYTEKTFLQSRLSRYPQLARYGVSTTEDASYYVEYFKDKTAGTVIAVGDFPSVMDLDVMGQGKPWTLTANEPGPKNLFGAIVQYNGPIRSSDVPTTIRGMTHVCTMYLSGQFCTGFRGLTRFYYKRSD